ncbi:MAG TPA: hypothetical protein VLQ79_11830 [Myxococcaceae bacterium]|nr:hypothetical protein [Myxococcaceae bacterium]
MRAGALLVLLAALVSSPAVAGKKSSAKAARRYGVLATGPSAEAASKAVVSAIKGVKIPDNRLQEDAQKYGVALGTDQAYQALALSMKLDAMVRVSTLDKGGSQIAVAQVRDGATGAIVDDATWKASSGKALAQTLSKQLKPRFQRSLSGTTAPRPGSLQPVPAGAGVAAVAAASTTSAAAPVPPAVDTPPLPTGAAPPLPTATATAGQTDPGVVGSSATSSSRLEPGRPVLDLAAGAGLFSRNFTYNQDIYQSLLGYSLGSGIAPAMKVTWAPLFGQRGYVTGHIGMSVGLKSTGADGTSYPSQLLAYGFGAGYRFLIGERSHVGLEVDYEHQGFSISGTPSNPRPDLPDVGYSAVAAGVDLRFSLFGPVSLLGGVYYRYLFSVGEIGTAAWFPHQTSMGVEANLGVGVMLGSAFEIRVQGGFQRYGFTFNPVPGAAHVAGGATDTYLGGGLFLAWML